jgi:hypothetical protein
MNSCPTRCSTDIAATARSTQFPAGFVVPGDGGTGPVEVGEADAEVLTDALALPLAVVPLLVVMDGAEFAGMPFPLPQAATVTSRPRATAQTAGRRTGYPRGAGEQPGAA